MQNSLTVDINFLYYFQKPVGGVALFGGDGPSFLTESLRSTSSRGDGDEEEGIGGSPGLAKKRPSSGKKQQGLGSGLFDDGEGEDEERGELFESTVRYVRIHVHCKRERNLSECLGSSIHAEEQTVFVLTIS